MIQAAIFDMDGTLVNNTYAHIRAFEIFCARHGVRGWEVRLKDAFGMGNDDIMRTILPEALIREKGLAALADEKEAIYRELYAPDIRPMAGLVELLTKLRETGIRCAVGSSAYMTNVDFVLEKCNIGEFFEAKISGNEVTHCKPHPEIYLTTAARLGCTPAECLVFEDAKAGIEAAKRAGIGRTIALATTLSREILTSDTAADLIIDDFRDVSDLSLILK
ncbi:MAG: HAD family phosphatase [Alistipes sp.]